MKHERSHDKTPAGARRLPSLARVLRYENSRVIASFRKQYDVSVSEARALFRDVLAFLWLGAKVVRSDGTLRVFKCQLLMDEMWHAFILNTRDYDDFCKKHFGEFLHHQPLSESAPREEEDGATLLERAVVLVWDELGERTARRWFRFFPRRYTPEFIEERRIGFTGARAASAPRRRGARARQRRGPVLARAA